VDIGEEDKDLILKKCFTLVIIICLILVSACGYKDIDKRFFVVTIGVGKPDNEEKTYKVTLKLAIPAAEIKAGQEKFVLIEEETDSITEALRLIKSKVDKELDFSHTKAIIIEETIAKKEDMKKVMDWFIRRRDIQKIAYMAIGKPTANAVLALKPESERLPSNSLFLAFGKLGTETPYIVTEQLFDFRKRLYEKGLDPVLPIIRVDEKNKLLIINQVSIFNKKNMKLILSEEDTKLFSILSNRFSKANIKVKSMSKGREKSFYIAADEAKATYSIQSPEGKKPYIEVNVKLEGIVEESSFEFTTDMVESNTKIAEKDITKKVKKVLETLQKKNLDPLGLGLQYRARHSADDEWEQWLAIYPDAEFKVKVSLTIQSSGGIH